MSNPININQNFAGLGARILVYVLNGNQTQINIASGVSLNGIVEGNTATFISLNANENLSS